MATTQSQEAKELQLVEKVELRIALADSEAKLQNVLNTYLPPLLLKLASPHITVRNKVISICQHVNTRIKPDIVQLPVEALLKQFKENPQTNLIRHFDVLYLQQGIRRLSKAQVGKLFPEFVHGIAADTEASAVQGAALFNLLLRSMLEYQFPPRGIDVDSALRAKLNISDKDAAFLSFWLGKLLLLKIRNNQEQGSRTCPGLSADEYSFLTLDGKAGTWDVSDPLALNITAAKTAALKALSSGIFNDHERLLPALFAAADINSKLSDVGEELMKRSIANADKQMPALAQQLVGLYFGFSPGDSKSAVQPVGVPVRIRILNILPKINAALMKTEQVVQMVEQDLLGGEELADISRPGRETLKLRSAVLAYLARISRDAPLQDLSALSRPVIRSLRDFIERFSGTSRTQELASLLGTSFEVISLLAKANTQLLVEPELELLRWLFDTLSLESDSNVVVSINEALSSSMRSFQQASPSPTQPRLRETLLGSMKHTNQNSRSVHYLTVCFANKCLPYDDVVARYIDLLALSKSSTMSHETVEEAKHGLDPYWYSLSNSGRGKSDPADANSYIGFPPFNDLAHYILDDPAKLTSNPNLLSAGVAYCRQAFIWTSLATNSIKIPIELDWDRKMDLMVLEDPKARSALRQSVAAILKDKTDVALLDLWKAAFHGMNLGTTADRLRCIRVFTEIVVFSPVHYRKLFLKDCYRLEEALSSNDAEIRSLAAQAYGLLLASNMESGMSECENSVLRLCEQIEQWREAIGAKINQAHGAASALAYFVSRAQYHRQQKQVADEVLSRIFPSLIDILEHSKDSLLREASSVALGQLFLFSAVSVNDFKGSLSYAGVIEKLSKDALSGNEKAIATLGYASLILDEENDKEYLSKVVEGLYALHEIRQPEAHFAVGDAFSVVAIGFESTALVAKLDFDGEPGSNTKHTHSFANLLDRTISACATTKPSLKKAAVIWLLCFIQRCGHRTEIQERLSKFQVAFKRCLSDRDELVQESASRGLGLVYEKGDREVKDSLVRDLVGSLSSNRADMSGTVDEDTQLFEPGALPTGDGSVTTYKDIISLAQEVGDSSLIYRFMSLASNNAIWTSRAAFGRFGLSNVFSDSGVNEYLAANPKLYPKLYRYRFDPNSNVRRSMNDIWSALVKDSSATINNYFDEIIGDLLQSIIGKEWRVREASCAAIADLLQGRKIEQISPYLDRTWSMTFKVLDDIKESVRVAAASLARVLSNILIRSLESSDGSVQTATSTLGQVIPFLMSTSGLESGSEDVRAFSLKTLLDIIKKARPEVLRPFVPELVEQLLAMLSVFEPEIINYLHLNAAKYNVTEQKIDEARLSSIRTGPVMEAIERCLDVLDDATMKRLAPSIQTSMKSAVGMPSKVGCSRLLVSLCTRRSAIFRPYSDGFLLSLQKCILDRNETVSSSYAAAIGYVARAASDQAILKVVAFAENLYFESEDDRQRLHSGELVSAIGKHATDRFAALAADILPLVFIARHDGDDRVKKTYQEVWDENAGGPRAAALYLSEIVALASKHLLESRRWTIKHAAATAVAVALEAVAASRGSITDSDGLTTWPALKIALAEKSWEGKERVLDGLVVLAKHGSGFWSTRSEVKQDMAKIAIREAKRRNAAYRPFAISALGQIAKSQPDADLSGPVLEIVEPVVKELLSETSTDAAANDNESGIGKSKYVVARSGPEVRYGAGDLRTETFAAAVEAVLYSLRTEDVASSDAHAGRASTVLDLLSQISAVPSLPVRLAVFTNTHQFLDKLVHSMGPPSVDLGRGNALRSLADRFADVLFVATDAMSESVRLSRAEATLTLARLVVLCPGERSTFVERLVALMSNENSGTVRSQLAKAVQVLEETATPG